MLKKVHSGNIEDGLTQLNDSADTSSSLLRRVNFSEEEVNIFLEFAKYIDSDEKVMKRVTNTYILLRLLNPFNERDSIAPRVIVAWIILCEQWPMQMTMMIEVLDAIYDIYQLRYEEVEMMTLSRFFKKYVDHFFNDIATEKSLSHAVHANYVEMKDAVADPGLFSDMIDDCNILVRDVGNIDGARQTNKLRTYTVNMEPTIPTIVTRLINFHLEYKRTHGKVIIAKEDGASDEGHLVSQKSWLTSQGDDNIALPFSAYSRCLAQFVVLKAPTPFIIGLFSIPSACKDDFMASVAAKIRATVICQAIQQYNGPIPVDKTKLISFFSERQKKTITGSDSRKSFEYETGKEYEKRVDVLYKWLKLGGEAAMCKGNKVDSDSVHKAWSARRAPYMWQRDLIHIVFWPFRILYWLTVAQCRKLICSRSVSHGELGQIYRAWHGVDSKAGSEFTDFEFVWFNAWLYSGTDNLWAAFIKKLHEGVEKHYGSEYAHAEKRAAFISAVITSTISLVVLFYGVQLLRFAIQFKSGFNGKDTVEIMFGVFAVIGSIGGSSYSVLNFIKKGASKSEQIALEVDSFTKRLGYMNEVRIELKKLGEFLSNPQKVNFWNYLLPSLFDYKPIKEFALTSYLREKFMRCFKGRIDTSDPLTPCKFAILVSDLDRCSPDKVVEIIKAIILLTVDTPFVVFLAGNPDDLSSAIEVENGRFYSNSGSSGYSFLDSIMDIPFIVPRLHELEKEHMLKCILQNKDVW